MLKAANGTSHFDNTVHILSSRNILFAIKFKVIGGYCINTLR